MFGYTLMLAGLTRIIDICFIPTSSSAGSLDDNESEHTLTSGINTHGESRSKAKAARAFRHLPPFVRAVHLFQKSRLLLLTRGGVNH